MKKILVLLLIATLAISSVACGKKDPAPADGEPAKTESGEVLLKFPHYRTGTSGEAVAFAAQIDRFNKKFEGKYRVELEEIPNNQYADKMKLLYQNDQLPLIFETDNSDGEWTQTLIDSEQWLDLAPYIEADEDFKSVMIQESIDYNTTEDGRVISLPYPYVTYTYMFYNKEIFANAGVESVPTTWDEFEAAAKKIKESGVTPVSFMTGENGWTTLLMMHAILASTPEGKELFTAGEKIYDFSDPIWVELVTKITEYMVEYGSSNALGAKYADAANAFFTESAAIMPQGAWFVPDLSNLDQVDEGFDQKIGVAAMPGNIVMGSASSYAMMVNKNASEKEIEGVIEFFKFMYQPKEINEWLMVIPAVAPHVEMTSEYTSKLTQPAIELHQVKGEAYPSFDNIVPMAVMELFPKNLPLLISGEMTPEEMVAEMTKTAQKYK